MAKTIGTLGSLVDTRRYIRSIHLATVKNAKELEKQKTEELSLRRSRTAKSDNIRKQAEKIYADAQKNVKLLTHIQITLKTHLYEPTRLNTKMLKQTDELLNTNKDLVAQTEEVMAQHVISTKPDDVLTIMKRDLVKKFSNGFDVTARMFAQKEDIFAVLKLSPHNSLDTVYCYLTVKDGENRFKTFINEIPSYVDEQNFTTFTSPSQAYNQIKAILETDGII